MDRGGAETIIMNLYRHIDRSVIQFDFAVHTNELCAYDEEIEKMGGRIYRFKKFNGINTVSYIASWISFLKKNTSNAIVHGHLGSCASIYLLLAKLFSRKTIAHSHATNDNVKNLHNSIWNAFSYCTRYVADYYMACSYQAGVDRFGEKLCEKRLIVLNNGIDVDKFVYNQEKRIVERQKLDISDSDFVIGHVGRISGEKNQLFIIDVFKHLAEQGNYKLILVGNGPLKHVVEEKVKDNNLNDKVIFTGVIEDVGDILQAMDFFIFPSKYEGLGISVIEAQASGLKVICSEAIQKEAMVTDLVNRMKLDCGSKEWAEYILNNRDYTRRNMGNAIREAKFDITTTAKYIQDFYCKICDEGEDE